MHKNYNFQIDEKLIIKEKTVLHQIPIYEIIYIYSESGISTIKKRNNEQIIL